MRRPFVAVLFLFGLMALTSLLSYYLAQRRYPLRTQLVSAELDWPSGSRRALPDRGCCCRHSPQRCNIQSEALSPVLGTDVLVVSAYWDDRETTKETMSLMSPAGAAVLLAVVKRGSPSLDLLRCVFCQMSPDKPPENCQYDSPSNYVPAEVIIHETHFNFPWATAFVICHPPSTASMLEEPNPQNRQPVDFVSLQAGDSPVGNETPVMFTPVGNLPRSRWAPFPTRGTPLPPRAPAPAKKAAFNHQFAVCISALFASYNNVLQFVQTVEMYRLLGATLVTIYNTSCGTEMERLLVAYVKLGVVEVVQWPIGRWISPSFGWLFPDHKGDVHYHGQIAAINDCIYRRMYDTWRLMLNDIDEVVMPATHCRTWGCLIDSLEGGDLGGAPPTVYEFESHVFPYTAVERTGPAGPWSGIPGHDIMRLLRREPSLPPEVFNPTKVMVNPRAVASASVHTTLWQAGVKLRVPAHVARMHHYRTPEQPKLPQEQLVYDDILWRFNASLIANVNRVLQEAGLLP